MFTKTVGKLSKRIESYAILDSEPWMFYNIHSVDWVLSICVDSWKEECAPSGDWHMKKHRMKLLLWMGLLVGFALLFTAAARADDVLSGEMEIRPDTLSGPANVSVSINIVNMSDSSTPITVTLYDPDGNVCPQFGSGGTATLAQGAFASYSGTWAVTQKQIDAGKVVYQARYAVQGPDGQMISAMKPISKSIRFNNVKASIDIQRSVPKGSVLQGQTVKLSYTLTNTGTVDITDIVIKDPGIWNGQVDLPLLAVGEKKELSYSYVADASSKTTAAVVTFKYESGGKVLSKEDKMTAKVIDVTIPNLLVQLSAGQLIVNKGDKVDLTCVITNKSNMTYEQIMVTDATLGDIESNLSLGAGESKTITKPITVNKTGTYKFTVTGIDASGSPVTYSSQEVTIQTTEDFNATDNVNVEVVPADLSILIEADRQIIYSEPSEIIFRIKVTNNGLAPAEKVVLRAAGKNIRTIDKIEPKQTAELTMAFNASMHGKYQFVAAAKDSTGKEITFESNVIDVAFTPTMAPVTPPPPPTEPPAEPTTEPTIEPPFGQPETATGTGTVLLYVLAGLLLVILLAVALLFFLDRRRGAPQKSGYTGQNVVIDSIQRAPHRDYARAPKRSPSNGKQRDTRKKPEPSVPSYAPSDAEPYEEPAQPAAQAPRAAMPDSLEEAPQEDPQSVYRRPAREERPERTAEREPKQSAPSAPAVSADRTEVYGSEYLSRIRGAAVDAKEGDTKESEKKVKLSDEEAALLSGSTGQYRLSRRAAPAQSPRPKAERAKAEDPEAFARKQRAARGAKPKDSLTNFYDDDDDGGAAPGGRHRR